MPGADVRVEGLAEFRRALKQVDNDLPKVMRANLRREVADPVAARIKQQVPYGPGRGGHWRDVIRGGATQREAYIQWGRAKVPYAGWLEFGGQLPSKRSGKTARVHRDRVPGGRYVYPEVQRSRPMAAEAAQRALSQTMARARLQLS